MNLTATRTAPDDPVATTDERAPRPRWVPVAYKAPSLTPCFNASDITKSVQTWQGLVTLTSPSLSLPRMIIPFFVQDYFNSQRILYPTVAWHRIVCKLSFFDYLDPSRKTGVRVRFPVLCRVAGYLRYGMLDAARVPFPDTRGFLYYHSEPDATPLEGGVRFRVTADNLPASFAGSKDLAAPSGFPWQLSLAQVACHEGYRGIAEQLVHENLVHPNSYHSAGRSSLARGGYSLRSAIARFERSTRPEHVGRRILHLRIVKIVTPVAGTVHLKTHRPRIVRPEEGQLFTVSNYGHPPEPWRFDIDNDRPGFKPAAALRALWDASQIP
ncbi:hypothetical protein FB451DRAFT_1406245 [Mycena latifolia]|nr:hypothetical protein FB451DRAFT_1406245 [Mycena latifolia]